MAKKSKHSTLPEGITKTHTQSDAKITEKDLINFTTSMIEWAMKNDEALDPVEFVMTWGIPLPTYYEWRRKYPIVTQADEKVSEIIGLRRDRLWLTGKHVSSAGRWIPGFKQRYKDLLEYEAKLKLENPQNETKIVILKDYPDAKEVT